MPKLNWKVSVLSVLALVISFANEKLSGPIGVNQSIVMPVADLILFESSIESE